MAARSQATLSPKKQEAIARAISANPNTTCAEVAKKARLKISQVACSGLWRHHLSSRLARRSSLARGKKVVVGKVSNLRLLSNRPTNNSHATIAELEGALSNSLELVKALREKLETESDRSATALKDLVGQM